jgi:putative transposase
VKFYEDTYYHLYNRTNNDEALFRSEDNFLYFLKKYRFYLDEYLETIGYCLMPTHFHFLVRVKASNNSSDDSKLLSVVNLLDDNSSMDSKSSDEYSLAISKQVAIWLRSYTRAFNNMWHRHGNLFNQNTNAKPVPNDRYLITLLTYIHQNPRRSGLVDESEEWLYSSYQDYIDLRNGSLPSKDIILGMIRKDELREMTERIINI